jgi:hypothetical protein
MFLTRFLPFVLEDRAFLDAIFWKQEEPSQKAYGIKLAESLMNLLFKHRYGVSFPDEIGAENYVPDSFGLD